MCECQGNPLARVTLALGLPYLLVNRDLSPVLTGLTGSTSREESILRKTVSYVRTSSAILTNLVHSGMIPVVN